MKAKILGRLIPLMPHGARKKGFERALASARGVSEHNGRQMAIAQLAAFMTMPLLRETLAEALRSSEPWRKLSLGILAPHLTDPMLAEALEVLQTIGDAENQSILPWLSLHTGDIESALDQIETLRNTYRNSPTAELLIAAAPEDVEIVAAPCPLNNA